ncbi:30S ribosomal protein S9 [Candidatus Falkowbacteria bacterium]|uniref:Small ribosomal subunit protein uS9 n=1 Tax=Candidatus Falkowbacteria bacterium CG10_big_fil_rev_8_21_14_0_10_37_18 TaxID=1974562 RepID=A0A2H0V8Z6_9BACT|nr:30S ribosomal protein S9 [Candidatus Falkowbacteria bacterium]NCQ12557.1 30S ribosomal protein S9 [Candidatus Falkowbacteria bacterium]PIR95543.1 MAG: 30S ribosomal protein S9 [Candidatus Falkowbacteria bacterium CG10_big_fil_rev_8_21_14_0_10_37_18]
MVEKNKKNSKEKEVKSADVLISEAPESQEEDKDWAKNETADFSGTYIKAVGRRKSSVAKVRLFQSGKGVIMVNGKRASEYFPNEGSNILSQPLKVTGHARDFNFSVLAQGGGVQGQVGAVRLGISRAILMIDPTAKDALKVNGFLTRDPRHVERKKPGKLKARKAPQWSKR